MTVRRVTHGNEKMRCSRFLLGGITWYYRLFRRAGHQPNLPTNRVPQQLLQSRPAYDVVETEDGYDIVLHFVKGGETDGNENAD